MGILGLYRAVRFGPWLGLDLINLYVLSSFNLATSLIKQTDRTHRSLDENLQRAFHKYLEIRGIKPSTTNFLHEYMINKDSREYLVWLKNLKKFIEK
ncbi:hypothetical protein Syun_018464 [Stephania yunnanensis]|uniref:Uncharacterized protein n=1 Tax=Stephania yunnanensis TaxID=152371 RepID=A0AAP0NV18_9MAGN